MVNVNEIIERRRNRAIVCKAVQDDRINDNFGIDPHYVGPVVVQGYRHRQSKKGDYYAEWTRRFSGVSALKRHVLENDHCVVDRVTPADMFRG